MSISDSMRRTLATLQPWTGALHHAGLSAGEVVQAGGSRAMLVKAKKAGWVNTYTANPDLPGVDLRVPTYYRTPEGTKVMEGA